MLNLLLGMAGMLVLGWGATRIYYRGAIRAALSSETKLLPFDDGLYKLVEHEYFNHLRKCEQYAEEADGITTDSIDHPLSNMTVRVISETKWWELHEEIRKQTARAERNDALEKAFPNWTPAEHSGHAFGIVQTLMMPRPLLARVYRFLSLDLSDHPRAQNLCIELRKLVQGITDPETNAKVVNEDGDTKEPNWENEYNVKRMELIQLNKAAERLRADLVDCQSQLDEKTKFVEILRQENLDSARTRGRLIEEKDGAYNERNRVVALAGALALRLGYRVGIGKTDIEGWEPAWHPVIYIDLPDGQASWHYHVARHEHLFSMFKPYTGTYDGHTTEQKYEMIQRFVAKPVPSRPRRHLTFDALRRANIERLPLFKNSQGQLAHTQPDGSDWSINDWVTAGLGELGELANFAKKYRRGDMNLPQFRKVAMKEIADTVIYLDILAQQIDVDLGQAVILKFNEVSDRVKVNVKL